MTKETVEGQREKPKTLIEGMKELRLILKKMQGNNTRVTEYASLVSTEKPYFDSKVDQKNKIKALIQANMDLLQRYLDVKKAIERTNLRTIITIGNKQHSVSELLVLKRVLGKYALDTYNSLNDTQARAKMDAFRRSASPDREILIERMYEEEEKHQALRYWQEFLSDLDGRLEVVNATTELIWTE